MRTCYNSVNTSFLSRAWLAVVALGVFVSASGAETESAPDLDPAEMAKKILTATEVTGGLVVHVGCGKGELTAALAAAGDGFLVQGWDRDAEKIAAGRGTLLKEDAYGRVSLATLTDKSLPYIDNLVRLVVVEDPSLAAREEIVRVVCPGGVAFFKEGDQWRRVDKPLDDRRDVWTHYKHSAAGNPVSHDSLIGPPRRLQWVGSPRWSRHHDHMASLSAMVSSGGRIFYIMDEGSRASIQTPSHWKLIARDAYSGVILWKRDIPHWHTQLYPLKSGPTQLARRLVSSDDGQRVYVTLGLDAAVTAIDAATGKTVQVYEQTASAEEIVLAGDTLLAVVRKAAGNGDTPEFASVQDVKRRGNSYTWKPALRTVIAIDTANGETRWRTPSPVAPLTLAAAGGRAVFYDGQRAQCFDLASGAKQWQSEELPAWASMYTNFGPGLVLYDGLLLFAGGENMRPHRGGEDTMCGLDLATGKKLWTAPHPPSGYQSPEDLMVAGGLIWTGAITSGGYSGEFVGRDPRTGEAKVQFAPDVATYWFHHRCHNSRATDNYLMTSRTGIEFLDIDQSHFASKRWMIHHWTRGGCLYGIMPANGMIYTPPHNCACYIEAKMYGLCALAPGFADGKGDDLDFKPGHPDPLPDEKRLTKGPAYDAISELKEAAEARSPDWPTYRGDNARSGASSDDVNAKELAESWKIELGGRLTAPTLSNGRLYVAQVDAHSLHALCEETGKPLWSFTAAGRIDSPPTIYRGRVIFGCADGAVYCLRAKDGVLAWKFLAAPLDLRQVAFEQVESVWPVHGSVLVEDGVLYFVAGRSIFLDGGMRLYRLEPATGKMLGFTQLDEVDPETGDILQKRIQTLQMPVGLNDILVSDAKWVYLKSQQFTKDGQRKAIGPHSGDAAKQGSVQRGETAHVFCPTGFLDDEWFHRSYWVYGRSFAGGHNGYHQAGKYAPAGRVLVFDDENVYGFGRKPQYYRWTTPLEHHLFSAPKRERTPAAKPAKKEKKKVGGFMVEHDWTADLPILVRALTLAGDTILALGPPDVVDEEEANARHFAPDVQKALREQDAALAGQRGAVLLLVDKMSGDIRARHEFDAIPVFDGMITASGKVFIVTTDGAVRCWQ